MIAAMVSGRVARDAEVRSAGQTPVLSFTIASDGFRNKEKVTDWIAVSLFGSRAEKLAQYIVKGGFVIARGTLYPRTYQGKDGTQKSSLELKADDIELGPKAAGGSSGSPKREANGGAATDDFPGEESVPF